MVFQLQFWQNMSKIKAVIFDFDGVIAESVNVKTEAFAEIYRSFGNDIVEKVVKHHETNGGISRYEKFKFYHENFLKESIDENKIQELSNTFSELVIQKVIDAPYVPGAEEYLSSKFKKYDLFISTGTPTGEINIILKARNINQYFVAVFGSPDKKEMHVKTILNRYNYSPDQVLFIGDAVSDRNAARMNHITFIGRYTTDKDIKYEKYLFNNFSELDLIIESLNSEQP